MPATVTHQRFMSTSMGSPIELMNSSVSGAPWWHASVTTSCAGAARPSTARRRPRPPAAPPIETRPRGPRRPTTRPPPHSTPSPA
eukprot:6086775-Prymnesium_polylepis.2